MHRTVRFPTAVSLAFLAAAALVASGCDSSSGNDASIKTHPDAMPGADATDNNTDGGVVGMDAAQNGMDAAQNGMDATANPDATAGACDPVSGAGCTAPNMCLVAATMNPAPSCRMEANPTVAFEQVCSPQTNNCAHGYACLQFQGEMGMPKCRKVCHAGNNADCAGLTGTSTNGYSCLLPFSADYGLCVPTPATCDPVNDQCPAMQYCQTVGNNLTACVPQGTATVGMACSGTNACMKGGICLQFSAAGPQCYAPCNPGGANTCGMNAFCTGIQGVTFGVCMAATNCTPVMDTCPTGQACAQVAQGQFGCATEGAGPGQPCPMGTCTKGYMCVGSSPTNATCKQACDMTHTCPAMAMCTMLMGLTVGVCP